MKQGFFSCLILFILAHLAVHYEAYTIAETEEAVFNLSQSRRTVVGH